MQHAQLWKRILNEGIDAFQWDDAQQREEYLPSDSLANAILKAPIIVDSRTWDDDDCTRGVPSGSRPAMPFPALWIEGIGTNQIDGEFLWGCHCAFHRNADGETACDFNGVFSRKDQKAICVSYLTFWLDCDGSKKEDSYAVGLKNSPFETSDSGKKLYNGRKIYGRICFSLAWDTLLFLACKNVSLAPHANDPKQVKRAIKRHGGNPDSYRYHTLVVRPPGAKSNAPAQEIGIMPRHVCRGHFSEYGPEFGKGLLFGKYAGRFYIPPHLKGDKKNGVVEKDYEIPAAASLTG